MKDSCRSKVVVGNGCLPQLEVASRSIIKTMLDRCLTIVMQ
ncbi:hypothetical protein [Oculatella sp. LEGE 06141]|nr:hypothetical protein [Oculatella sp. LEGE 06141]